MDRRPPNEGQVPCTSQHNFRRPLITVRKSINMLLDMVELYCSLLSQSVEYFSMAFLTS